MRGLLSQMMKVSQGWRRIAGFKKTAYCETRHIGLISSGCGSRTPTSSHASTGLGLLPVGMGLAQPGDDTVTPVRLRLIERAIRGVDDLRP